MSAPASRRPPPRAAGPVVALVPLRDPGVGKTRLAGALTVAQRAALAGAMLADVVAALAASPVDRTVVAASGPAAAAAASALGVEVLDDPPAARGAPPVDGTAAVAGATSDRAAARPGTSRLDVAIAAATGRLGPVGAVLVVAGDLPHLTAADVAAVLAVDAEVVVAATTDGGTGGLLRRPPDACATAYGPGSAARHLAVARAAGRRAVRVEVTGFAHDVDVAADLAGLRGADRPALGPRTAAVVAALAAGTATTG